MQCGAGLLAGRASDGAHEQAAVATRNYNPLNYPRRKE
jgi:hypothetical protein